MPFRSPPLHPVWRGPEASTQRHRQGHNDMTRSNRSARAAGSRFEKSIADALAWHLKDDRIERRVTNGAKDRGDIASVRTRDGQRLVVECKDHARLELGRWVTEAHYEAINDNALAGFVVHKRRGTTDPLEQYVTLTLGDLLRIGWGVSGVTGTVQS